MDALQLITDWMKSTDLAEISYRKDGAGFSLAAEGCAADAGLNATMMPSGRFSSVAADAVGIFQWNELGKPRKAEEGALVAEGDVLGVIVTGCGAAKPIVATRAGRVSKLFIEAGHAVEYGQPILLLESR